jgi:mannose-6-phosphate isomerase-like protein (cupin superfamily)
LAKDVSSHTGLALVREYVSFAPTPGPGDSDGGDLFAPELGSNVVAAIEIAAVQRRLAESGGGYEIVHRSPGLEIGVYVLVAPEPDRQQPHEDDEVYVVLEGRGVLTVEGEEIPAEEGEGLFVPAGAEHRFTGYEGLSLLVIFRRPDGAGSA